MEKIETNAVKITGINIEHIEFGPIDIGLKGKQNFISLLIFGIIFYAISQLPLGGLTQWFQLFYVLSFVGSIGLFVRQYINPNFGNNIGR